MKTTDTWKVDMEKTVTLTINEQVDLVHLVRLETTALETRHRNVLGDPITAMHLQTQIDRMRSIESKLLSGQ